MNLQPSNRGLISQASQAMVERADVPRSTFKTSYSHKTTFDAGLLIPFIVEEVLPGDHFAFDVSAYVRIGTMIFPMLDNQRLDTFFFFVPNRLVWSNWRQFMGEQRAAGASIAFTIPQIVSPAGGFAAHSIYDQMGIPVVGQITAGQTISVNALPLRCYGLIYQEWFRDENVDVDFTPALGDGPDLFSNYGLALRRKSHDYFTSALPWPQKFTVPGIPLTGTAPITGIGVLSGAFPLGPTSNTETGGGVVSYPNYALTSTASVVTVRGTSAAGGSPLVYANLDAASATLTINSLRQAWMLQSLVERDSRGGTRYIELVKSHFGVTSPDSRQQRPEYIGGGSTPLAISAVAATGAAPGAGSMTGQLAGAGVAAGQHRADYAATEHGYIIGLCNIKSDVSYQQGLNKLWRRSTRYDFYWPSLSGLGEQAILREEIFCNGVDAEDTTVFGYQERWHEYRTKVSTVAGLFRSTTAATIHQWHLSQQFSPAPTLNATFLADTPPMSRVLSAGASTNQQYLADFYITRTRTAPIPMFGTPQTLSRF